MIKINENFLKLQENYLFSDVNKRVEEYLSLNPNADLIKMGIGDVTRPIPKTVIEAIKTATDELGDSKTFRTKRNLQKINILFFLCFFL